MRKTRILLVTLLAAGTVAAAAPPASACGGNEWCDRVNEVCRTALGTYCLR